MPSVRLMSLLAAAVGGGRTFERATAPGGRDERDRRPLLVDRGLRTPTVVTTQGSSVTFVNLDVSTHDVTSRTTDKARVGGKLRRVPLFTSGLVPGSTTAALRLNGPLAAGDHAFFCSLHPGMRGTLRVS